MSDLPETDQLAADDDPHAVYSAFREKIVEHSFVAQFLKAMWKRGIRDAEVAYAEVDSAGHDVILSVGSVVRHVQLKSTKVGGKATFVPINTRLATKPSGCVIWAMLDPDTLDFKGFRWFGGLPGSSLPSLAAFRPARHTKGNALGFKAERRQTVRLPASACVWVAEFDGLLDRLFALDKLSPALAG